MGSCSISMGHDDMYNVEWCIINMVMLFFRMHKFDDRRNQMPSIGSKK